MALLAGTIDASDPSSVTGTGLAIDLFNQSLAALPSDKRASIAQAIAPFLEGLAAAIVSHITTNAQVTVVIHTTDSGLQRMSNPVAANADTQGPGSNKNLTGTVA